MSSGEQQAQDAQAAETTESASLLDQVLAVTPKATDRDVATDMIKGLVEESLKGTVTWDKNVTQTINKGIAAIDEAISKQVSAVMHHDKFTKLEGTWRGLHYLVMNSETGTTLRIKAFNVSKKALFKDLDKAVEFDQSQMFKKLYENEFGMAGGEPFGALIGDYEFTNHPEDIELLSKMSNVAAAAFCPFISAASEKMFGMETFTDLSKPRDLAKIFDSVEYAKWKSFRESEDSRFVTLTMPRSLARLPYGATTKPIDEFAFEEAEPGKQMPHEHYCWMNTAYVMGARLTDAFSQTGFCTAIRGKENGGLVQNLPTHIFRSEEGDPDMQCPTEVPITDRREAELSKLGFLPLVHYKNTDYAVFFGGQSSQKPKQYDRPDATANAEISARLPYIMATSRFSHYLKVMARDMIGSFKEVADVQKDLQRWINNYVSADPNASAEARAKFPLREAKVMVEEVPGKPGSYHAVCYMRPWLQMEELTASMRMVAKIPGS